MPAIMDATRQTSTIFRVLLTISICVRLSTSQATSVPTDECVSLDLKRRYECVSRQCLRCATPVANSTTIVGDSTSVEFDRHPANCTYDPNTSTLSCIPDTSTCTVEDCQGPCQYCLGVFHKLPGGPLSGDSWEFTSLCVTLQTHMGVESCESYGLRYPDRCISHLEFDASERERVLSGESELLRNLDCSCYELNCTARVAEITIEFREQPTNPSMSDREMETTPVSDESAADALSHVTITIVISAVAFGIICIAFVVVGVVCCRRMFKTSSTVSTTTQIRLDDQPNDQPWQLINLIGQGRFGYVYKARYCNDIVAVKIFTHHSRTAWETECTLNSMESTAHENIVEFVTKESRGSGISLLLVIITRYYQLGSLNQFLRSHVVSLQQANVMINSVANGLAHLHADYYTNSNGIVAEKYAIAHRNMKSANVLVKNENGDCVIGDLGFAMILDPSLDSKELASTEQVGTFRYMAPEVFDTRVYLLDLQSFKQIDVYAFSLIMWEVMSRCCILNVDDVPGYQLPYEELAGTRPSLDTMKDIVVTRKLRPALPPMWANDECLKELYETLVECWDEDPEARLSAANVIYRMEEFTKELGKSNRSSSSNVSTQYNTMATSSNTMAMVSIGQPMECSQSSPPPYYSPTDPNSYHNPPGSIPSPPRQHFFPDSMSIPTAIGRGGRMGGRP